MKNLVNKVKKLGNVKLSAMNILQLAEITIGVFVLCRVGLSIGLNKTLITKSVLEK